MMRNKYGNRKIVTAEGTFDSHKEYQRYGVLRLLERTGRIKELKRQVKFVLIPTQRDEKGKLLAKECAYYADFTYRDSDGAMVVEDAKGARTEAYKIKKKLMLWVHGIRIKES